MKQKRYSEPCRRFHPNGAIEVTVDGKKRRCYEGWFVRERDPATGRRRWLFAGESLEDARTFKAQCVARAASGERDPAPMSFSDLADEYLAAQRGKAGASGEVPEDYKDEPTEALEILHLRLAKLKAPWGPKRASDVSARDVERFLASRDVGPRTKRDELHVIRRLFRWAQLHRLVKENPTDGVAAPKPGRRAIPVVTREHEAKLLAACCEEYSTPIRGNRNRGGREGGASAPAAMPWSQTFTPPPWLHPLVLLALRTALRLKNLLSLEWGHIDLKNARLRISGAEMKNGSDLDAPLHPEALQLLRELRERAGKAKVLSPRVLEVVSAPLADRSGRRTVARVLRGAVKRSGYPARITMHDCRRVAATRMLEARIDLRTVMAMGGWSDPSTLLRCYATATETAKAQALSALG